MRELAQRTLIAPYTNLRTYEKPPRAPTRWCATQGLAHHSFSIGIACHPPQYQRRIYFVQFDVSGQRRIADLAAHLEDVSWKFPSPLWQLPQFSRLSADQARVSPRGCQQPIAPFSPWLGGRSACPPLTRQEDQNKWHERTNLTPKKVTKSCSPEAPGSSAADETSGTCSRPSLLRQVSCPRFGRTGSYGRINCLAISDGAYCKTVAVTVAPGFDSTIPIR